MEENQFNQTSPTPPQPTPNGMSVASMILGIVSLVLLCCGGVGIPVGALGIMFALLSRRGRHMNTQAKIGFGLSIGGICTSILVLVISFVTFISSGQMTHLMEMIPNYNLETPSGMEDFMEDWQDYLYGIELPD